MASDYYSLKARIQNAILSLVKGGTFYRVLYNPTTGLVEPFDLNSAAKITPSFVAANEIQSTFSVDKQYGRHLALKKTTWSFEALVTFDVEVTLEYFERSVCSQPPTVSRNDEAGDPQVRLVLLRTSPIHPVQQQSSNGTQVRLAFEAILERI